MEQILQDISLMYEELEIYQNLVIKSKTENMKLTSQVKQNNINLTYLQLLVVLSTLIAQLLLLKYKVGNNF